MMDNQAQKQPMVPVQGQTQPVVTIAATPVQKPSANTPIMHNFTDSKSTSPVKFLALFVVLVLLGIGTGFVLSKNTAKTGKSLVPAIVTSGSVAKGKIFGSDDTKTFKDTAEGTVQEGGIEGEGQYHLVRPGGDSQNVYMTSSSVDLSQFINKKVKVWGQTQQAQKAGWLMDVGRVEVE